MLWCRYTFLFLKGVIVYAMGAPCDCVASLSINPSHTVYFAGSSASSLHRRNGLMKTAHPKEGGQTGTKASFFF
ncbi:hypothetical protein F4678DRAFT_438123 [Xylaria arbuscula]|nr:hypothetical protein F4678DRAFT_438123 [Xylaria arbuscula]